MAAIHDVPDSYRHRHVFLGEDHSRNERRIWFVVALTAAMMVVEIVVGTIYGSMALVADGWHMATHAAALLIAALAYRFARKRADDPRFTFGTGKVGDLAAFASAIILALIALLIGWESAVRLFQPVAIGYSEAIPVAVVGLVVNVASAWLLMSRPAQASGGHDHHAHAHPEAASRSGHGHAHGHSHGHADHNMRAAYLHVIADAFTSVLAIVALAGALWLGWNWLDPVMGIVGALLIARWSWGLLRSTAGVLLDRRAVDDDVAAGIARVMESEEASVTDLHLWQLGPGHTGAIIAIAAANPRAPSHYKRLLGGIPGLSHVTIEVEPLRAQ